MTTGRVLSMRGWRRFLAGYGRGFGRGGSFFRRSFVAACGLDFLERWAHVTRNGATSDLNGHDGSCAFKKGDDKDAQDVEIGVFVIGKFDHVGCDGTD